MDSKFQELTSKLVAEGVEKGEAESAKIIAAAQDKAAAIVAEAKKEAEDIVAKAGKDSASMSENVKSELKMFNAQALNALKTEIANVVCDKVTKQTVKELTDDKAFMQEFMLKMASEWAAQESIVISTADAAALKAVFAKKVKALLDKKVKIEEVNGKETSFTIAPANGAYKVEFGEAEFEAYFKNFLRPQLVDMLF